MELVLIGSSYFVGAIPFGYLIVKILYKKDIRDFGSGNPGATNVGRSFSRVAGAWTLVLDGIKGFAPVWTALQFFPNRQGVAIACGLMTVLGHNWSLFLKWKGGKGVATSMGVFFALTPIPMAIAVGVFIVVLLITKHVSVGSMAAALVLMGMAFIIETTLMLKTLIVVMGILILIKHIPNMKRLKEGTESKIKFL